MGNQCTKFEVSSLSRFRDIVQKTKKIKIGHKTLSCPFQGHFDTRRQGLAMINLYTKFEVSTFTHYKGLKGNAKCRNWGGLGG